MSLNTPQSLITFALKAAGVLGVGQSALAEDNSDTFDTLNAMLGQWQQKRWMIWHLVDVAFTSTGAQSYSVGPGGNFNVFSAPSRLEAAFFRQISSQSNQISLGGGGGGVISSLYASGITSNSLLGILPANGFLGPMLLLENSGSASVVVSVGTTSGASDVLAARPPIAAGGSLTVDIAEFTKGSFPPFTSPQALYVTTSGGGSSITAELFYSVLGTGGGGVSSVMSNSVDYPLKILQSREDYNNIALKTLTSWPEYIFYDSVYSSTTSPPFCGFVYPWPIPQASLYELHLTLKEVLSPFTSYTQQVNLPGEYFEAIWSNLALRLPAIYPGANVSPSIENLAKASMETIRVANTQIPLLRLPPGLSRPALYNIFSDQSY
jgi:hypothetical protein